MDMEEDELADDKEGNWIQALRSARKMSNLRESRVKKEGQVEGRGKCEVDASERRRPHPQQRGGWTNPDRATLDGLDQSKQRR